MKNTCVIKYGKNKISFEIINDSFYRTLRKKIKYMRMYTDLELYFENAETVVTISKTESAPYKVKEYYIDVEGIHYDIGYGVNHTYDLIEDMINWEMAYGVLADKEEN